MLTTIKRILRLSDNKKLVKRDMYGHPIIPIGDSGYGVSVTFYSCSDGSGRFPDFSIFHESDGFRQSLTSLTINRKGAFASNAFEKRIAEVLGDT